MARGFEGYKDYAVKLKQKGSLLQQTVSGDTLFGKFAWSIWELYGEENLKEILNKHAKVPQIIFSGIFPYGWVPAPVFSYALSGTVDSKDYRLMKEAKKLRFVPLDLLEAFINGDSSLNLKEIMEKERGLIKVDESMHVSISRADSTAIEGMLFSQTETWFSTEAWVFVRVSEEILSGYDISEILEYMFITGVGARKSTGKGSFDVISIEPTNVLLPFDTSNAFISLNRWIPESTDPSDGFYRIRTKNPRLSGLYSSEGIFQKKVLMIIEEGSWFFTEEIRPWFGRAIENVQMNEVEITENIIQSTYCLPLYFKAACEAEKNES